MIALPIGAQTSGASTSTPTFKTCGSSGKNINVVPGNSTLSAALAAAAPGDSITLAPGTYPESVTIDKDGIALRGSGEDTIISTGDLWGVKVAANTVCVEQMLLRGPAKEGLLFQGSTGASALNVTIAEASGAGVLGLDSNSITLTNMKISNTGVNGVVMTRVNGVTIQDSQISSQKRGIHLEGVRGSDIFRNTISGVGENGIVAERSTGPIAISHNTIRDGVWDLWILASNGVRLEGDDVGQYRDQGIRIEGSQNVELLQGGVHDGQPGAGDGINVRASNSVSIIGTTVNSAGVNSLYATEVLDFAVDGLRSFAMTRGVHVVEGARVSLKNIHIENPSENGIVLENTEGPSLVDHGSVVNATWGLWLLRSNDVTVDGTILEGSRDLGTRVEGSRGVTFRNFTVRAGPHPTMAAGIDVFRSLGVSITGSNVSDTHVNGIIFDRTNDIVVEDTVIHNAQRGIHLLRPDNARIAGNTIDIVNEDGIVLETARRATVEDNQLRGGQIGIWFRTGGDKAGNVIRNNDVRGFLSSGISLDLDTRDHTIQGNTVTNSTSGIRLTAGGGSKLDQRVINNLLVNNTITGNQLGIVADETRGGNQVTGGTIDDNSICDFFVVGDASLKVSAVDFRDGNATANDPSKIQLADGTLGTCTPTDSTA